MRHLRAGRKLNRSPSHRKALFRNLTMALIQRERIVTTSAKAKAVRPFVEKLITLAKKGTLHARRIAISRLGPMANAQVAPEDNQSHQTILQKLFDELGPRFEDRPGGYTRIIKRHYRRLGDAGETVFFELLQEGEEKVMAKEPVESLAPEIEEEEDLEQEEMDEQEEDQEEEETGEEERDSSEEDEEDSEDEEETTEEKAEDDSEEDEEEKKD